jgi:(aminoalkyl)phosphonate N-acetyltransferase
MEPNCKIRVATLADLETIFYFICHLEEKHFDFESFAERFKANLGKPDTVFLVSTSEADEVTGFISCQGQSVLHREGKSFEIEEVYVARPWRGKGIGKALLGALKEKLRKTSV